LIQKHIGISKTYNVFELQLSVLSRDFGSALKITSFFVKNPKVLNIIPAIGALYNVYSRLIKLYYAKDKSKQNAATLGISFYMHPKYVGALKIIALESWNSTMR